MVEGSFPSTLGSSIQGAEIDDGTITLAKLADGTAGKQIGFDAAGAPEEQNVIPTGMMLPCGLALDSVPDGWLLCDGSAISRTTYANLFGAVSTRFGVGDGSTTFNIPDMRERVPRGAPDATEAGATGGADTVGLSIANMPSHNHTGSTVTAMANVGVVPLNLQSGSSLYSGGASVTVASQGSGSAHENKQKYVEIQWMIKT